MWDDLTFSANIPAAPSMLTGELRDYQLQVRDYARASMVVLFQSSDNMRSSATDVGMSLMTQGLRWLVGLHDNGCNGILADEVLQPR